MVKYTGVTITELNAPPAPPTPPKSAKPASKSKGKKDSKDAVPAGESSIWVRPAGYEQNEDDSKPWSFRCKCGEVCSSYELPLYHPKGQWFECSQCAVWSHVLCLLGNLTPEQVLEMKVCHYRPSYSALRHHFNFICVMLFHCCRRRCASAARRRTGATAVAEDSQPLTPTWAWSCPRRSPY